MDYDLVIVFNYFSLLTKGTRSCHNLLCIHVPRCVEYGRYSIIFLLINGGVNKAVTKKAGQVSRAEGPWKILSFFFSISLSTQSTESREGGSEV